MFKAQSGPALLCYSAICDPSLEAFGNLALMALLNDNGNAKIVLWL